MGRATLCLFLVLALLSCSNDGWNTSDGRGNGGDAGGLVDGHGPGEGGVSGDGIKGCNPQTFTLAQPPPPEVYLVLDRSGSMAEAGASAGATKWQELEEAVDFVLQQFESTIRFGLLSYPVDSLCAVSGPQVRVGLNSRQEVMTRLQAETPAGGTPTVAALNNAAQSLNDIGEAASAKYIVLASDGGPNCNFLLSATPACSCTHAATDHCCTSYPQTCYGGQTCLDETRTLQVIKDLHDKLRISTFVIGLAGTAEYTGLLDAMAQAGGAPKQGGATAYYPAGSKTEIQGALQAIAGSVISCVVDLKQTPDYPDKVLVYLDGKEVPRDAGKKNGWSYTDSTLTKIELYGPACATLQDGKKHTLTATFACVVN